ncbi:MAG TPA: hypothetical protein VGM88_03965 [Kofleriaceae bacterium]
MKAAALLGVLLVASVAHADDDVPARARALAEQGKQAHERGDYATAIASFQAAYALSPTPALVFNIAQAYRLSGDCVDAALLYKRFLETDPSTEARAIAESHLATVQRCDKKPVALTGTAPLDPRAHRHAIERDTGIALGAAGLVALGVGTYFAVGAHDAEGTVSDGYAHGAAWNAIASENARGERDATRARYFMIGGGAAIATGAVFYLLGRHTEHAAPIAIVPTRGGAHVSYSWRF